MRLTRKTYTTRSEKNIDFVIGFVGLCSPASWGALAAFALALFITICLAALIGGVCFGLLNGAGGGKGGAVVWPAVKFLWR